MGIGSVTFSLPHFLSDHYMVHSDLNTTTDNICRPPVMMSPAKAKVNLGDEDILEQLPGLDKIKELTEGKVVLRAHKMYFNNNWEYWDLHRNKDRYFDCKRVHLAIFILKSLTV